MRVGIRVKILVSFLICSLIAVIVAMGGAYYRFRQVMINNVSDEISMVLSEQRNSINKLLGKIENCGELVGINDIIINAAYSEKGDTLDHQYDLKMFSREISNIYELSIDSEFGEYGLNFYVNENLPIAASLLDSTFAENSLSQGVYSTKALADEEWYIKTMEKDGDLYTFANDAAGMLFFSRKIDFLSPLAKDKFFGVSVVGIDFKRVLNTMEQRAVTDGMSFVVSYNGEGVVSKSELLPEGISVDDLLSNKEVNSYSAKQIIINNYIAHITRTDNGIGLLSFASVKDVTDLALANKSIIVPPVLITFFLLIFMAVFISSVLNKPLRNLVAQLNKLDEKSLAKIEMKRVKNDEVGDLYYAINSLIERVNSLVSKIADSAHREKELEIKMHQMKITPHFLYNTLDAIFWKAEISGETEIADMVSNLSNIFEYSIRGEELTSTLANEVSVLEDYVEIQRRRYNSKIEFFYDIGTLEDAKVPKNILQPLVENSIIHGMEDGKVLEIFIWAQSDGDKIEIHIQDNGKGNCARELNAYLAGDENILKGGKIGVSNVNKRLAFIYGEGSGLHYENNPQGGLTVTLFITLNETGG